MINHIGFSGPPEVSFRQRPGTGENNCHTALRPGEYIRLSSIYEYVHVTGSSLQVFQAQERRQKYWESIIYLIMVDTRGR